MLVDEMPEPAEPDGLILGRRRAEQIRLLALGREALFARGDMAPDDRAVLADGGFDVDRDIEQAELLGLGKRGGTNEQESAQAFGHGRHP